MGGKRTLAAKNLHLDSCVSGHSLLPANIRLRRSNARSLRCGRFQALQVSSRQDGRIQDRRAATFFES
jgi:hypothetical protein